MNEARLDELLEAYLDQDLTPEEAGELRDLVEENAALRERFVGEVRWHLRLGDRLHVPAIPLTARVAAMLEADEHEPRTADAVAARIATRSSRRHKISVRLRRRRMPMTPWWMAIAAGLLVCVGLFWTLQGDASAVATVRGERGVIERAGVTVRLSAQAQPLNEGDVVAADGVELLLRYHDGTTVELSAGGRLTVIGGTRQGAKRLELEQGGLLARVAKQRAGEALVVATPQANATVLGTTFRVRVESLGTRLVVDEGRIAFAKRSGGAPIEVAGGRSALAGIDGSLALVEPPARAVAANTAKAWTPEPFSPTGGRPFTDDSPYNLAIPAKPVLDRDSAAMAARLATQTAVLALFKHALPLYDADANTPVRRVTSVRRDRQWPADQPVRVPDGVRPNSGSNRALVVLDWNARRAFELYRFAWDGDGIRIEGGGSVPFDGNGVPIPASGYAGGSYLAGLLRVREIAQGRIPHALAFGTSFARKGMWRHPAQQTDGKLTGPDTIPVGARIQLDPALDLDAIPGLTPGERTIAVALQTYGAYCVGASGEPFLFFCELAPDAVDGADTGAVYTANGLANERTALRHIPFTSLRVLGTWDGRAAAP